MSGVVRSQGEGIDMGCTLVRADESAGLSVVTSVVAAREGFGLKQHQENPQLAGLRMPRLPPLRRLPWDLALYCQPVF
jgi:hypothetical protein